MDDRLEFLYVGDPMCSWCWGFAPVVERLEERFGLPVRVLVGGLRPGPAAQTMDEGLRRLLAHHWDQVGVRSGQPFNPGPLGWEGWSYDTEPPCRAVVTMRELDESRALPFFTRLQRAFYVDNLDVTSPETYPELVVDFGVDPHEFAELLDSEQMRRRTWEDFRQARSLGVNGFPTLLIREGDDHYVVSRGYAPLERLAGVLTPWLAGRAG